MKQPEHNDALPDEVIAELHRVKREISAGHSNDVRALARALRQRQPGLPNLVSPPARKIRAGA